MAISFKISSWLGWCHKSPVPGQPDIPYLMYSESPDVTAIPPMLRRKLNVLGRACASLVLKLIPENSNIPIVYCSQHGDIDRTIHVLNDLTDGEVVSPMQFSLAVHNAICGVLSIQTRNRANISALAAGQEGLIPMLLEAAGLLQSGEKQVVCVMCDAPIPEFYRDEGTQPTQTYAVAFMLTAEKGTAIALAQLSEDINTPAMDDRPVTAISLIDFLSASQTVHKVKHNGSEWQLSKLDCG
ncbi:beta-ketoacyl synthase chain length factor [Porticoccaceae bacterium]|nr:beta-ketoacyl synthase chain length factor [Porticoccaceae bacterium]